jgi:hypothetical protein
MEGGEEGLCAGDRGRAGPGARRGGRLGLPWPGGGRARSKGGRLGPPSRLAPGGGGARGGQNKGEGRRRVR